MTDERKTFGVGPLGTTADEVPAILKPGAVIPSDYPSPSEIYRLVDRLLNPTIEDAKAALYGWCNADPATKVFSEYQIIALESWQRAMRRFAEHAIAEIESGA